MTQPTHDLIHAIRSAKRVACVSHVSPDADALGSLLGLTHALQDMGKTCFPFIADAKPEYLSFLPGWDRIRTTLTETVDTIIVLDCADSGRTGEAHPHIVSTDTSICIDHHMSNPGFCRINWVDPKAGSTSEMVVRLLQTLEVPIGSDTALCLYAGILADSGRFLYDSTSPQQHRLTADLMETGMDWMLVHRKLYQSVPYVDFLLEQRILDRAQFSPTHTIVTSYVTLQDIEETGGAMDSSENALHILRDIEPVEVAFLLKEKEPDVYKVSLRSKNRINVSDIAQQFGGGGHLRASGCICKGPLDQVLTQLISAVHEQEPDL